jgi:protein-tyrosine phosphatase
MPEGAARLTWAGCVNVRDLGGLPTSDGGCTRPGALVRADALDRLTSRGWAALHDHGVRTVIDLRNPDERAADLVPRPDDVTTVRLPLENEPDPAFWRVWADTGLFATPLYFRPFVERFPAKIAALAHAVAEAPPGGVVVHCRIGRDRTGLAAFVLLLAAGVLEAPIIEDYLLSDRELASSGHESRDVGEKVDVLLATHGTTARAAMERACEEFRSTDVCRSVVADDVLTRVRRRLTLQRSRPDSEDLDAIGR